MIMDPNGPTCRSAASASGEFPGDRGAETAGTADRYSVEGDLPSRTYFERGGQGLTATLAQEDVRRRWTQVDHPRSGGLLGLLCELPVKAPYPPHIQAVEIDVLYRIRPPGGLEEPNVPAGVRWWNESADQYVEARKREWAQTTFVTNRGILLGFPDLLRRAGVREPVTNPGQIAEDHLRRLTESGLLTPNGLGLYLAVLRGFLRWAKNPLADDRVLWRVNKQDTGRRRWLSVEQAAALWNHASEREKVPISLMLFSGLRRIEVLRLHVRDLDFTLPAPTMRVLGKGGKWRTVDMAPVVYSTLLTWTQDRRPPDAVWPWGETTIDRALQAAAKRAGFPTHGHGYATISGHDLRRTFIRLALETHKLDLWDVAALVGHASVDMTVHYAGLNRTKAAEGLRALEASMGLCP